MKSVKDAIDTQFIIFALIMLMGFERGMSRLKYERTLLVHTQTITDYFYFGKVEWSERKKCAYQVWKVLSHENYCTASRSKTRQGKTIWCGTQWFGDLTLWESRCSTSLALAASLAAHLNYKFFFITNGLSRSETSAKSKKNMSGCYAFKLKL